MTVAIFSIGITFVMLNGEINLSIVSVAVAPLMGIFSIQILGFPVVVAILLTILIEVGAGLINGLMV